MDVISLLGGSGPIPAPARHSILQLALTFSSSEKKYIIIWAGLRSDTTSAQIEASGMVGSIQQFFSNFVRRSVWREL